MVVCKNLCANGGYIGGADGLLIGSNGLGHQDNSGNYITYLGYGGLTVLNEDNVTKNVVFKAGDNFCVDEDGVVYAKDYAKISELNIVKTETANSYYGRNLLLRSGEKVSITQTKTHDYELAIPLLAN
jgi:hypothetical protein